MVTSKPRNRLREARNRCGLSLNELARLINATPQGLQWIETRGKRRPGSIDLEKLARVLGTTVDELFPVAESWPGTADVPPDTQKAERTA